MKGKRLPADTRPPYARNPHRVASVGDIEARARRLFDPLRQSVEQSRTVKPPSIKALTVNRNASTVAAYFTRQTEQNLLKPAQRQTLRRINKQFFDVRRLVFSDQRLTRQDKAQLVAVLTFERLKAHEAIHNPQQHNEVIPMGSAEIRKMIVEEEPETRAFTISGPTGPDTDRATPETMRTRTKKLLDKISQRLDQKPQTERERERERELNAKDLYTRKSKFSQNVHYLDKATNKTLFVDTGKSIAMRRTGITESGVAVALQLAKERFGSTLTINGTSEFKKLVIEAAAKNGLDVHFTDKSMNEGLAARRAELEIEREGQGIAQASAVDLKVVNSAPGTADASTPAAATVVRPAPVAPSPASGTAPGTTIPTPYVVEFDNWASAMNQANANHHAYAQQARSMDYSHVMAATDIAAVAVLEDIGYGPDAVQHEDKTFALGNLLETANRAMATNQAYRDYIEAHAPVAFVEQIRSAGPELEVPVVTDLQDTVVPTAPDLVQLDTQWCQSLDVSEEDIASSMIAMQVRGENHANWLVTTEDSPEAIALITRLMGNDAYRESFKDAIQGLYVLPSNTAQDVEFLDAKTSFVEELVNRIEGWSLPDAAPGAAAQQSEKRILQGELLAHGAAPYQHNEKLRDKPLSYFVTIKPDGAEPRTVWGVGLEDVMSGDPAPFKEGDRMRLVDLGTVPVTVPEEQADGSIIQKSTHRREWAGQMEGAVQVVPQTTTASVAAVIPAVAPEQEHGMNMD